MRTQELLSELQREFSDLTIRTSQGDTSLKSLRLTREGGLSITLENGMKQRLPAILGGLNDKSLRLMLSTARDLKERGIINSVMTFFKFSAILLLILLIGVIVLVFATIGALFK